VRRVVSRVVVLAGGSPHAHDFAATGGALAELAEDLGHDVIVTDDPDVAAGLLTSDVDALVVDGLWWRMEGEAYDRWRSEHAYSPPTATRAAITAHVHGGGGLLAVHTASICFDDWPEWGDVVGGAWRWAVSSHPPLGPVSAHVVGAHPVVDGLPKTIELRDEVYGDLELRDDIEVLVTARRSPDDEPQPVVWLHRYGDGRVVYDGFGHDMASIRQPDHTRLLAQALTWISGDR
jgi:uncharacterized protein